MVLVRINERTLVQKIKRFVLGSEKPELLIRLSVMVGFLVWLYFAIWEVLIFLSIVLVNRLKDPKMITDTFNRIGTKYAFMHRWGLDTLNTLLLHSTIVLGFYVLSLAGLVLIYRKIKRGYILYLLGNGLSVLFTFIFLGQDYFVEQISLIDKIIFLVVILYFMVGLFFFKTI